MCTTTRTDLSGWLEQARQRLAAAADQPSLEAQALLGGMLGRPRAWIFAHGETPLSPVELERLNLLVERRLAGEPLPYLLGKWEFYGLEFEVSPAVLIPRPETELLVDLARAWLQAHPARRRAADAGTGSGCIAAALVKWTPDLKMTATDCSPGALQVAARTLARLGLTDQVQLVQADLIAPLKGPFDVVCANLPYIPSPILEDLDVVRFEPRQALDGGHDGLRLIEPLLVQAVTRLAPGGRILLEIEISQDLTAPALARRYFPQACIELKQDLAGLPRVLVIDG